jgi:3-hydroxy-9,10-secoandrosta-1,3,5(10)-triene-9,17-dione monooxygenase
LHDGNWRQGLFFKGRTPQIHGTGVMTHNRFESVDPVNRAAALAPVLRERAALGENLRRLPDETAADLVASRLLRLCQPARYGGAERGLDEFCEMLMVLGRGDGAQAWVASVYGAMAYQTALFEDQAQQDVWAKDPSVLIAGSLVPVGNRVEKIGDGYRLSGKWPFNSGAHHADWLILGDMADIGTGKREHAYFLVPAKQYRIEDDWFALGLSGTGSSTVTLDNVFVPEHRVLSNRAINEGNAPGSRVNPFPLYRMPLFGYLQLVLASVPIGVAAGMVEDFKAYIHGKTDGPAPAAGVELLHQRLADAAAASHAAMLLVREAARRVMTKLGSGANLNEADAGLAMRDSGYALRLAKQAASTIFEATGAHGLYLNNAIQRGYRDIHAAGNHGSLNWERSALRFAQTTLKS